MYPRTGDLEGRSWPGFWLAILLLALALAACAPSNANRRPTGPQLVAATPRAGGPSVITTRREQSQLARFFSAENLRETVFTGNTDPRLSTPEGGETSGRLNLGAVNGPRGSGGANSELQMEFVEDLVIEPLPHQPVLGGQWQSDLRQSPSVALSFTETPLREVAEDILGGILGVNYLLSDNLEGSVTFRSEEKFSKTDLVQILADILARNGYLIQYFNGIYHVAPPDELEVLTGLRTRSGLEGSETQVIELSGRIPENLVEVLSALTPPGLLISRVEGTNNLAVRGDPSQVPAVEELAKTLIGTGQRRQLLSIIPLRRASPSSVAEQLGALYEARNLGDVLFVPVEQRQGILVVARSQAAINQARELARGLDVDTRDQASLRVIQLSHLDATEAAAQLNAIFGGGGGGQVAVTQAAGTTSSILAAGQSLANAGDSARGASTTGDSIAAPRFLGGSEEGGAEPASVPSGGNPTNISIGADPRSNALLVQSSYAEFRRINDVVRSLDVPLAQVVIEATIVEVTINDALQYGVQTYLEQGLNFARSTPRGRPAAPEGGGFAGSFTFNAGGFSIQTVVSALQAVTNVKVISSPYLTVADGKSAELNVGDEIPFVVASQTSNSDGRVVVTQEVQSRSVGVQMSVTPRISPSNQVLLDINQTISSAQAQQTLGGTNPTISQRSVSSQVSVQSGHTVLLGGLISERSDTSETGVPVLRQIPVLGNLFNTTSNTMGRNELLIMLTPRVVRNGNQLSDLTRQLRIQSAMR